MPQDQGQHRRPRQGDDACQPLHHEDSERRTGGEELDDQETGQSEEQRHSHCAGGLVQPQDPRSQRQQVGAEHEKDARCAPSVEDRNALARSGGLGRRSRELGAVRVECALVLHSSANPVLSPDSRSYGCRVRSVTPPGVGQNPRVSFRNRAPRPLSPARRPSA